MVKSERIICVNSSSCSLDLALNTYDATLCGCMKTPNGRSDIGPKSYRKRDTDGRKGSHLNECSINMSPCCFLAVWLALVCLVTLSGVDGFNLDAVQAGKLAGTPGSYFGYSVASLEQSSSDRWILIGAPRAADSSMANVTEPGTVTKCRILPDLAGHQCDQLLVDNKQGTDSAKVGPVRPYFSHGRDNQWLGASIDVNDRVGIVVCAPRWFNKYFEQDNEYYMNGICYEVPTDFNPNNVRKHPVLVNSARQTMPSERWNVTFDFGMGCLGQSTHYTKTGSDLLIGAPGLRAWTGGFVDLRQDNVYFMEGREMVTEDSELYGYAITSGRFFPGGVTYFALGGPRFNLKGRVLLFRGDGTEFFLEDGAPALDGMEFPGIDMPINGYFGAALWAGDVNNDGYDDLLVGAPFYSISAAPGVKHMEEGAVFVYLSSSTVGRFDLTSPPLYGSQAIQARFGSAISSLGDINDDGYNDIVVGAPYEDEMTGAIYVYNGCNTGIWPHFSQRMSGKTFGVNSFGISLSKPIDLNRDSINDIAVGAYLSDTAVVLYGRPVVMVQASISTTTPDIDPANSQGCIEETSGDPCVDVSFCAKYDDRKYNSLVMNFSLSVDAVYGDSPRLVFAANRESQLQVPSVSVFLSSRKCVRRTLVIQSTADLVTPVVLSMDYKILIDEFATGNDIKPVANQFNGHAPEAPLTTVTKKIEFRKDCPDNVCKSDLKLEASLDYDKSFGYFIVGTSPTFAIDVTISKTGHPSYGSNLYFTLPRSLQYRRVDQAWGDTEILCGFEEQTEEEKNAGKDFVLMCGFGNPMVNNTGVRFSLVIGVPEEVTESEFRFLLNATTLSEELYPADNTQTLRLALRNKVSTLFRGVSNPPVITLRSSEDTYHASHIYEVKNEGPSPLPESFLLIRFPEVRSGAEAQLYLNRTTYSCKEPCHVACSLPDASGEISAHVYINEDSPSYTVSEAGIGASRSSIRTIDCTKETCAVYECGLLNIPPRESAVISLDFVISEKLLGASEGRLTFATDALVNLRQEERLITSENKHAASVSTEVIPETPPPQPLPWWVILLSVLGGILLIVLIVVIFWKCGFFRRKQKEEMDKRKQEEGQDMLKEEPTESGYIEKNEP